MKGARTYPLTVALDLETTGLDPYRDRIIEIGAVAHRDGAPAGEFSELVQPGVPLSPGLVKLTGITPAMLEGARGPDAVLEDFLAFMPPGALCLAHNAQFDRAFLRQATGDRFPFTVLDTVELSRICFPRLASHGLGALAEALGLPVPARAHRALDDARQVAALWERLLAAARVFPLPVVDEITLLMAAHPKHPYSDFFRRLQAELVKHGFGGGAAGLEALFRDGPGFATPPAPDFDRPDAALPLDDLSRLFGPEGPLAKRAAAPEDDGPSGGPAPPGGGAGPALAYEHRPGQVQMARAVAEAMNLRRHLVVEAGTGTGKSLAYLAPAALWTAANRQPVIVSTNTKNLQAQLFEKDLPLIREALGIPFKAALIKGRRNYLCLRKLFHALRHAGHELDQEERLRMANILPWAASTATGDIAENIVDGRPGLGALWAKLSSMGEECLTRACRWQRKCFLWKARAKALAADIVVANHSLVFADMGGKSPSLPKWEHIIFDEAHNLEEAATSHLSVELSPSRLRQILHRLLRTGRRGAGTGLLAVAEADLAGAEGLDGELRSQALAALEKARAGVLAAQPLVDPFFAALAAAMPPRAGGQPEPARFFRERKLSAVWDPIESARQALFAALGETLHALEWLSEALDATPPDSFAGRADRLKDLYAAAVWLREVTDDGVFVLDAGDGNYVYWIEPARGQGVSSLAAAFAAPVSVGALLHDQLYSKKRTVVFCSATMTVRGSFDFLGRRLGIDRIEPRRLATLNAGTPFDYPRQCLVMAPVFLPEPGERDRDYADELATLLAEVFRRTGGRALGLFTSHDMLSRTADGLERRLEGDGIGLLVQGRSGSREGITGLFKRGGRMALLGTHSFWEGVDVVGQALSCLVIARLPFMVQTDPLVAARCEQVEQEGGSAFMEYSLPSAVIRFRQGFGRLIRHRGDRGVVILADRRVVAKRYGQWFLDSLPAPTETFPDREVFLDTVEEFVRIDG